MPQARGTHFVVTKTDGAMQSPRFSYSHSAIGATGQKPVNIKTSFQSIDST